MGVAADLLAGTASGMSASLAGQPLDTVRVRLQSRGHFYRGSWDVVAQVASPPLVSSYLQIVHCVRSAKLTVVGTGGGQTARADGARGFFRGAIPPLLGMGPKNALGFGAHGQALRFFEGGAPGVATLELKRNAKLQNVAGAGCVAGLIQCAVVVPSDRIKCQLQVQGIQQVT
jgi:solute carrier family 25 carnitine/acylcarnitine transporter 20/29